MIKAFVYNSKIVINDSSSECKDPPNGINCMHLGGAAGTWEDRLRIQLDLYHQERWQFEK